MRSRFSHILGQTLIVLVMAAFAGLIGRLVYINARHGSRLLAKAERQQQSVIPLKARRGFIVDSRGRILGGTILRRSVFADPKIIPDKQRAAELVGGVLGLAPREVCEDLVAAGDRRFFVIQRGVTEEQAERIRQAGIHGIGVFDEPGRTYPLGESAAQVIGFVAADGHGVAGVEHQFDKVLAGENGVKTIVRDARRKAFWLADGGFQPARDGLHVVLTIDADIQATAERAVQTAVDEFRAECGIAIVMHPKTGAILAMVNVPRFDPNRYGEYQPERYRNRAITDPIEPGSTFKPFVAAAALEEGVTNLGEVFDCEKGLWKDGPRLLHDHHPYGLLTFRDVIIKSSNIGMAKVGKRLGNPKLYECVTRFGFGRKTGIDLLGEDAGIVLPLRRWNGFSTTSIPIGQEIAATPLQLATAFCVFANGGLLVKPHAVRAILDANGNTVQDYGHPPPAGRVLPEEVALMVREQTLAPTVNEGTGTKAALASYQVFGKTGTAQIAKRGGGGYKKNEYVGAFIGAAPCRDPQLVVLVAIIKPDRSIGYYGGTVAAPAAGEILSYTLAYLQVPPERVRAPVTAAASLDAMD